MKRRLSKKNIKNLTRAEVKEYLTYYRIPFNNRLSTSKLKDVIAESIREYRSNSRKKRTSSKKLTTKKNASFRSIGQNVIITIEGEKFSKKEPVKENREELKQLVNEYIEKGYKKTITAIKRFFTEKKSNDIANNSDKLKKLKNLLKDKDLPNSVRESIKKEIANYDKSVSTNTKVQKRYRGSKEY
jgi:hypothetical protein